MGIHYNMLSSMLAEGMDNHSRLREENESDVQKPGERKTSSKAAFADGMQGLWDTRMARRVQDPWVATPVDPLPFPCCG